MKIVVIGQSKGPSSDEAHVETYRALVHELASRGHDVLLLERGVPVQPAPRRSAHLTNRRWTLYSSAEDLKHRYIRRIRDADMVIVASPEQEGVDVSAWVIDTAKGVKAFFDANTPATLQELERGEAGAVTEALIPKYDLYLASVDGPALEKLQREYHSPMARTLDGGDRAATLERYVTEVVTGQLMA